MNPPTKSSPLNLNAPNAPQRRAFQAVGIAVASITAQAKEMTPFERCLLVLGACVIGAALAHELGGEEGATSFLLGAVEGVERVGA